MNTPEVKTWKVPAPRTATTKVVDETWDPRADPKPRLRTPMIDRLYERFDQDVVDAFLGRA